MANSIADDIAAQLIDICSTHLSRGTEACAAHLLSALPSLAASGAHYRRRALPESLCAQLSSPFPNQRRVAATLLGHLGHAAAAHPEVIAGLSARCMDRDARTAAAAIRALERLAPLAASPEPWIGTLIAALARGSEARRRAALSAVETLARMGHREAVEAALKADLRLDRQVRAAVTRRLAGDAAPEHGASRHPRSLPMDEAAIRRPLALLESGDPVSSRRAAAVLADQMARGVRILQTPTGFRVLYPVGLRPRAGAEGVH